jgi:hypothetical protein
MGGKMPLVETQMTNPAASSGVSSFPEELVSGIIPYDCPKGRIKPSPRINEKELAQRVAILKRFKELLIRQRDRFYSYLNVLDKQQELIVSGSAENLLSYVEMEEQITADIFSIQKVIDPLESMYRTVVLGAPDDDVPVLKMALEQLKTQAIAQSNHNRALLSDWMANIRTEIKALRSNPFSSAGRSPYQTANTASLIDIRG